MRDRTTAATMRAMARFEDRATRPIRGPADLLRWRLEAMRLPKVRDFVPARATPRLDPAVTASTWLGHASFLQRWGGQWALIDPVLVDRLGGVVPRWSPPGLPLEALPPIDVVLLTHDHRDHLDSATLERLPVGPRFVVPLGNARFLPAKHRAKAEELDWWQSTRVGGLEVTLVPARHWSMRMPWDRNDALWGGWVLKSEEGVAYHAGDTALFDGFTEIAQRCGPIDHALLPIGAYAPRWFMEPQHMDPDDALIAFERLGAQRFIAMHWATFPLTDEPPHEPAERLRSGWAQRGWEGARLTIPAIGETVVLERPR